jgi:hypothetical protein
MAADLDGSVLDSQGRWGYDVGWTTRAGVLASSPHPTAPSDGDSGVS